MSKSLRGTTVAEIVNAIETQVARQVEHWVGAASRLRLDDLASSEAWGRMESYLGISVRRHLQGVIDRLAADARALQTLHAAASDEAALGEVGERAAAMFRRHRIEGVSQRQIADEFGVSLSTVESDLRRAYGRIVAVRRAIDEA